MDWNRCGVKQYTVEEGALVLAPEAASKVQKMYVTDGRSNDEGANDLGGTGEPVPAGRST